MRKSVYVHIGLPKTGTSSIQALLRARESILEEQGVLYPGARTHPFIGEVRNHVALLSAIWSRNIAVPPVETRPAKNAVSSVFEKFFSSSSLSSLIWSHETLSETTKQWDTQFLRTLVRGADIAFILYARFTDEWLESRYRQMIWSRSLLATDDAKPMVSASKLGRSQLLNCGTVTIFDQLMTFFPDARVILRSYDAARKTGNLLSQFLQDMAVPLEGAFKDVDATARFVNSSRSAPDTLLLYRLWIGHASADVIRSIASTLVKAAPSRQEVSLRVQFLPKALAAEARESYARDRELLQQLPPLPSKEILTKQLLLPRDYVVSRLGTIRPSIAESEFVGAIEAYDRSVEVC